MCDTCVSAIRRLLLKIGALYHRTVVINSHQISKNQLILNKWFKINSIQIESKHHKLAFLNSRRQLKVARY